jgi:hypothetical protein
MNKQATKTTSPHRFEHMTMIIHTLEQDTFLTSKVFIPLAKERYYNRVHQCRPSSNCQNGGGSPCIYYHLGDNPKRGCALHEGVAQGVKGSGA